MKRIRSTKIEIPANILVWLGYIGTVLLFVILPLTPNMMANPGNQIVSMLIGGLLGVITFMYQNLENRLNDIEEMTRLSIGQKCVCLHPTTSSRYDVTVQKLALRTSKRIYLMYLGERMPRLEYQEQVEHILEYVKMNRGELSCRHLILATPKTINWINSQVDLMKEVRNFDLSCFIPTVEFPFHHIGLSIQLFDEGQVLLVDPGKSTGTLFSERDIFLSQDPLPICSLFTTKMYGKKLFQSL